MPRLLFVLFLQFLPRLTYSQSAQMDSLGNFSYLVVGNNKKGSISSGTGSVITITNKHYLLTNFHVLTGKDHVTDKKFDDLPDTSTSITVLFQPLKSGYPVISKTYAIYKRKGKPLFKTMRVDNERLDLAVLRIKIPRDAKLFSFSVNDIDTTLHYRSTQELLCFGFPSGVYIKALKPDLFECKAVGNYRLPENTPEPFVYFDRTPYKGLSGAPMFVKDSSGDFKFLSVLSNQSRPVFGRHVIKGRSIYAVFALQLIDQFKKQKKRRTPWK